MAQVPATSYESTSLGDVAEFTIPFPFLSRAEVFVTVDGAQSAFTWINDGLVQLAEIPELGAIVRRYRSTEAYVPLHQFSQGVPFLPRYVDRDFKQTLYAVQESVNDTAGTAAQALAIAEESLVLVQDAFDILGERTQYMDLGPYAPGLEFQTTSQVFSYAGEFYAPGPSITLPYTTTGAGAGEIANFRSVGDAVLRADLADNEGAALIGYKGRDVAEVLGDKINVKDHGATGDGITDETAALQDAIDDLLASQGFQTTLGAVTGGYVSNVTTLVIPRGIYKISDELVCPAYFKVIADNAVIVQTSPAKDIFANPTTAYQWEIEGVHFSGGRCHANMGNANVDVTRWTFRNCTFSLSSSYAVRTFPVGGASSHLSANLLIKDCAFYKPKKLLLNFCDSATVEDCWVFVSKDNFDPSTAVFENGSLTCDGYPNLYLRGMFGVPAMGTHGVDRLANVRWCDLLKGGISADRCRLGGEFAGMPVVYNLAANNPVYPFIGPAITIHNSECFGGPSAAADSGIVSLQAQIPARISIHNCLGPVEVPYITNAGNQIADIPAYFAAYELASGQKAYTRYNFDIRSNSSLAPNGSVYGVRVPAGMRPYCNERRQTKVSRAATQVLANGFASNIASFDTVDFDSQGGFSIANPTRIVMPTGATSMRIQAHFSLNGSWSGNTLRAAIVDSSLAVVAGQGFASNVNADDTQYTLAADVFGSPGDWWAFEIKHNAVAAQNMVKCTVTTSALDYIS